MPIVKIDIKKGKDPDFKKKLLDIVHHSIMEALDIPDWDRFQRINEYDPGCFETPEEKTDDFMIIEITMFQGRTKEQKKDLIEKLAANISCGLSVKPTDIFVVIKDPPDENWGLAGRQRT